MISQGQLLGDTYLVESRLSTGGMGEVYRVRHIRIPREFALKILRSDRPKATANARPDRVATGSAAAASRTPSGAVLTTFGKRFRREAEILATLRHPNIVDIVDWNYTSDGAPYLVLELLEGENLRSYLRRHGALDLQTTLYITAQIGAALTAAHQAGVVHRDLKPSNVFLQRHGPGPATVKVLDFGVAHLFQPEPDPDQAPLTGPVALLGTPGYMAPEQARGDARSVDGRADQFALAALFYEMLAGRPAFYDRGEPPYQILERVLYSEPAPIGSPALWAVLERALHKHPAERYPTIADFLAALQDAASREPDPYRTHTLPRTEPLLESPPPTLPLPAPPPAALIAPPTVPTRRGPALYAGLVAGLLGLVIGAWLWAIELTTPRPSPPPLTKSSSPPIAVPRPIATPLEPLPVKKPVGRVAAEAPASLSAVERRPQPVIKPVSRSEIVARSEDEAAPRWFFIVSGASREQEELVRDCTDRELRSLVGLRAGDRIVIEKSPILEPTGAPAAVQGSGFAACLRKRFFDLHRGVEFPRRVVLEVTN